MRTLLRKIVQILDGTPAAYGHRRAGQSVVELALITPILIILFSGMVEIGWFANNYLTLLDVTRAGARRGATLQNQMSPQGWDNRASYMPVEMLPPDFVAQRIGYMPYEGDEILSPLLLEEEQAARAGYRPSNHPGIPDLLRNTTGCGSGRLQGFYNDIICTMISSMSPLSLDPENGVDDVVVSAFSLEMVDPNKDNPTSHPFINQDWLGANRPVPGDVPQVVVVGRYPTNANECDAVETVPGSNEFTAQLDPRDPFDFNENELIDMRTTEARAEGVIFPYVWNDDYSEVDPGYDSNQVNLDLKEKQVGFVWFGQHRIELIEPGGTRRTLCLGSQWSSSEVETMINLTGYVPEVTPDQRGYIPGTGLVLVEIHWQHEMLLKLPVFNPVFNIMSPDGRPPTIYVWAAFPLPSTDPSIQFREP